MPLSPPSEEVIQVFFVTRKKGLTRKEMQRYWKDVHGPLTVQMEKHMGFTLYEQWHALDDEGDANSPAGKQRKPRSIPHDREFDGMSVLWYKDLASSSGQILSGQE